MYVFVLSLSVWGDGDMIYYTEYSIMYR